MGAPQKFRQRYLAFQVEEKLHEEELENFVSKMIGDMDLSYYPWIVYYSNDSGEGLLRCEHLEIGEIKNWIKEQKKLKIEILGVSGTIKKARQKFLRLFMLRFPVI